MKNTTLVQQCKRKTSTVHCFSCREVVIFTYRNPDTASVPWKESTLSLCSREGKHTLTCTTEEVVSISGDAGSEGQATQLFDLRGGEKKSFTFPMPHLFLDIPTLLMETLQKLLSHTPQLLWITGGWYNQFAPQAGQNVKTMQRKVDSWD